MGIFTKEPGGHYVSDPGGGWGPMKDPGGLKSVTDPGGGVGFKDSDPNPGGGRMKDPGGGGWKLC
ncbi:hypothetical protein [Bacillus multifaciens]|uniref:hypothetical protein n=1 Tax=Bacillus multifaciens TaxID=3068506 RepID=UPI0027428E7F|nr:hypothetical protein [Bacillus sp. WLY-B-L8]MDP7979102.1 hypothetical protein [Bacillus sp. WLY-B-L8]